MASPPLAPAGSSQYTSDTLFVGDGTWDTQRNTFLLPNLVGLNFETMRYNGMGNRFRGLPQYHNLIRAHGVIAALTFLVIVPAAIITVRFHTNHRAAVRIHIWLQILTVLLGTVVFALGWLAVGPNRSLTNPHHGIGLAIYVLILVQAIGGSWVHHKERKKRKLYEPLTAMLHHWLGRTIALLGLAQVPLGLTLYGSPRALFGLYALAAFVLLVIYFVLTHRRERRGRNDYDSRYSYGTGSAVQENRRSSGVGGLFKAGAAGIGVAALANRFRHRSRSRGSHPEVVGSRRHSGSFIEEEKYSRHGKDDRRQHGWTDKLLKIGAVAGAIALVRHWMGGKKDRDRESDIDEYAPHGGGASTINPGAERIEGRPLPSVQHPLHPPGTHRRSNSSLSYSSYSSAAGERRHGHALRDTVAGLGALGLARNIFKGRRERKEQRRLETQRQKEVEKERRARANNQRYTGDGFPRRNGRRASFTTSTDLSTSTDDRPRFDGGLPPPVPAGVFPAGIAGAATAGQSSQRNRQQNLPNPSQPAVPLYSATEPLSMPPIGPGPVPIPPMPPGAAQIPYIPPGPALIPPIPTGQVSMPPLPPDSQGLFHPESSGSEAYISPGGRNHRRHSGRNQAAAAAAGMAAGATAAGASSSRQDRHQSGSGGSVASPPVSVKVKVHSDGRHVTLRRLPEEEAAADRQRRSKDRHGRRRKGSFSSLGETSGGSDRWRRTAALEQQQEDAMRIESENLAAARSHTQIPPPSNVPVPLPPLPPVPSSSVGPRPGTASVGSPGTYDGEATEASAEYANNRRRRRAERAQAKQAREGRSGSNVGFS